MRVLVVEDSKIYQMFLRDLIFPDSELTIEYVDSLASALKSLALSAPDAILLDINLPDAEGLTSLQSVLTPHPNIPIICLTADPYLSAAAMKMGASDYIDKTTIGEETKEKLISPILKAIEVNRSVRRSQSIAQNLKAIEKKINDTRT